MLPGEPERSIDEFISKYLTEGRVTEWLQSMTETSILLQMPKFDLAQEHDLQSVLGDMGMDGAFDQTADFYNINESEQLYLSEVRHKTILRIGESGTNEAPGVSTTPDRRIQLNRPFVFLLREQHSGLVLLMGKVGDPAK